MRNTKRVIAAVLVALFTMADAASAVGPVSLIINNTFEQAAGKNPAGFVLAGNATYENLSNALGDTAGHGVALRAGANAGTLDASVSQLVKLAPGAAGSYRFSMRGLAPERFKLSKGDKLNLRVEFLDTAGASLDSKALDLYGPIEQARHDLNSNGNNRVDGSTTWRSYTMDFAIPFKEVALLKLSVEIQTHTPKRAQSAAFLVDDFDLSPIADLLTATTKPNIAPAESDGLLALGGRWFYARTSPGEKAPAQFDHTNADRLIYFDGKYSAPFADNTSAWLHAGNIDLSGKTATSDSFVADNVTIRFDQSSLIVHTHGLPNHPTGQFPQQRGNPNPIAEQDYTFYLPLNPQPNPNHIITDTTNSNRALNMGPIGVSANGVVFFNPFDATSEDASNFMDACCGHPNFDGLYHYHKYPICVNTPWMDAGDEHSPVLGWAFDGYPIYGPYESKDVLAKDATGEAKLNGFNMHYDANRGWHYHVTPGKFPYIIGGYWGSVDQRDIGRPHHIAGVNTDGMQRGPGSGPPQRQGFGNGPQGGGPQGSGNGPPQGGPPRGRGNGQPPPPPDGRVGF